MKRAYSLGFGPAYGHKDECTCTLCTSQDVAEAEQFRDEVQPEDFGDEEPADEDEEPADEDDFPEDD